MIVFRKILGIGPDCHEPFINRLESWYFELPETNFTLKKITLKNEKKKNIADLKIPILQGKKKTLNPDIPIFENCNTDPEMKPNTGIALSN